MREPILCDCHFKAKLAERDGARIIIRDKQYGELHTVVIDIEREYRRLKNETTKRPASP